MFAERFLKGIVGPRAYTEKHSADVTADGSR